MDNLSGIGVLDKSMAIVVAVAAGPSTMTDVVATTGISRATAHRLVVALEVHGLVRRDRFGMLFLGAGLMALGRTAAEGWSLPEAVRPVLSWLRDATGESVQLYVRDGDERRCLESLESTEELRTTVPVGARLPLELGSAGHVLREPPSHKRFRQVRWVESVEERAPGVASVSAAVQIEGILAAVSLSGPVERTTRQPGRRYGARVVEAADRIEAQLAGG